MKNRLYGLLVFFLAVSFATPAFATNGMRMIGFGPVQRSMGGTSVGVSLDAASVLSNPAGMNELGGRIDFGASYFKPTVEYNATETTGLGGQVIPSNGTTFESDRGPSPIPAFGLIIPVNDRFHFGLGAYGVAGMGVDYEKNLYNNVTYSSYSQMRFAPGVSYKVNDMASVGVVANLMYATMEFNAGNPPTAGSFPQQAHMGASSFGYGATLGVKVTPMDMLTIGAAYETKSYFQDFKFNTATGKDNLEFNQPSSATIGFGFKIIPNLILAFDFQWIRWSETNGKDNPEFTANGSGAIPWNLNWEDQYVYKIGIQYTITPMFIVRAGYNYGKMPLDSDRAFENIAFPAIAEHHYTAGVGIKFSEKFTLNIGGMYSPEATLSGSNNGFPPASQGIASYETKMSQYSIDVGISYVF